MINAVSGVSGAGRKATMTNSFCEVSLQPYGVFNHRHQPELATHLGCEVINTQHLGNFKRGILATITMKLADGVTEQQRAEAFSKAYQDKPLVRFSNGLPRIQDVEFTPFCDLGWKVQGRHIIVVSAIDNLLKGASSQAMQCLNIHYGFDELTALVKGFNMSDLKLSPLVIKLGGAALDCAETLSKLFGAIAQYQNQSQRSIVIVHGGGYLVDELMAKLQLQSVKKDGLRVTPYDQLPIIAGALAGTANKMLHGQPIKDGSNAVGLSLADGGLCHVEELDPELGAGGKATPGDSTLLQAILATGAIPIISSIGLTAQGQMMNVNADQAAVAVAGALDAELVLLSDVSGVLDGKGHHIATLDAKQADALIAGKVITDGMIVKVKAALEAAQDLGRPIEVATWRYQRSSPSYLAAKTSAPVFYLKILSH